MKTLLSRESSRAQTFGSSSERRRVFQVEGNTEGRDPDLKDF